MLVNKVLHHYIIREQSNCLKVYVDAKPFMHLGRSLQITLLFDMMWALLIIFHLNVNHIYSRVEIVSSSKIYMLKFH